MRTILAILPALALAGCVSAETGVFYETFEMSGRAPTFCENYAQQTYWNAYESLVDQSDSFGARSFGQQNAERVADRAYERCLSGRLN